MKFFPALLLLCPAACLLAQTPPPPLATPAPKPPVSFPPAPPLAPKMPVVPPDRVVIQVGGTSITAQQFDDLLEALPEPSRTQARTTGRKQFADQIVKVLVLAEEGRRRKLDQNPKYQIQSTFTLANILAGATYTQLGKEGKADEADLKKYYDEHPTEFETVTARHILIRMQGAPVPTRPGLKDLSDAEALAKAQDIRKRILAGEDFATLAKAESDDTGSGSNGGSLGAFSRGQMVPSFEAAAFSMKPGDVSEPIKTQFGYHIIKVESHQIKTFEEARPEIEKKLTSGPQVAAKALDALVQSSRPVYDPEFFNLAKQ